MNEEILSPSTPASVNGNVRQPSEIPLTATQAKWLARIITTLALHTERAARWVVLLVMCGSYGFALWRPTTDRSLTFVLFAVLIFAPMWWRTMFPKKESRDG